MEDTYSFDLPTYGSSWKDTGNEAFFGNNSQDAFEFTGSNMGNSNMVSDSDWFDFGDQSWYVDSTSGGQSGSDTSWLSDAAGGVWDWLKSPQGTSVTSGAIKGLMSVWQQDLAERMKAQNKDDGPSAAELYDARVKAHNASINAPVNTNLVRFSK